jgi:hypothetical protein
VLGSNVKRPDPGSRPRISAQHIWPHTRWPILSSELRPSCPPNCAGTSCVTGRRSAAEYVLPFSAAARPTQPPPYSSHHGAPRCSAQSTSCAEASRPRHRLTHGPCTWNMTYLSILADMNRPRALCSGPRQELHVLVLRSSWEKQSLPTRATHHSSRQPTRRTMAHAAFHVELTQELLPSNVPIGRIADAVLAAPAKWSANVPIDRK